MPLLAVCFKCRDFPFLAAWLPPYVFSRERERERERPPPAIYLLYLFRIFSPFTQFFSPIPARAAATAAHIRQLRFFPLSRYKLSFITAFLILIPAQARIFFSYYH